MTNPELSEYGWSNSLAMIMNVSKKSGVKLLYLE